MNYEQRLRAVGHLIDRTALRSVCILEHDHGVLVVGLAPVTIADEQVIQPTSIEFDEESIQRATVSLDSPDTPPKADETSSTTPTHDHKDRGAE